MTKRTIFLLISSLGAIINVYIHVFTQTKFLSVGFTGLLLLFIFFAVLKIKRLFTARKIADKLVIYTLYITAASSFLFAFPTLGIIASVTHIILSWTVSYILLLTINIYIVSEGKSDAIPLLQPAKLFLAVIYIYTIFLATTQIYKINIDSYSVEVNLIIQAVLFIFLFCTIIYYSNWFLNQGRVGEIANFSLLKSAKIYSLVGMSQFALVIMLFPFEPFGRGILVSAFFYLVINIVQSCLAHKYSLRVLMASIAAFIVTYLLVIFL